MATFNVEEWLVDRQLRQGRGRHLAVETPTAALTYDDVAERVGQATAGLRSLDLRPDDRVFFVANDDLPLYTGILAAFRGGFVAVPLSTMLGAQELHGILVDCGASVVVAGSGYAEQVLGALADAPAVRTVVWDGTVPGAAPRAGVRQLTWGELMAAGAAAPEDQRAAEPTSPDGWALWLYTSGTTGTPKGAMHRHENVRQVCECYGWQVLGIRPEDRVLSVAKLFFAYGIGNSLFFPLSVGATTLLEPARPTPEGIRLRATQGRPTLFFGVPTFFAALTASDIPDDTFSDVRLATSAGEVLPAPLQARVTQRFGFHIIDGIGSTECLHIYLSNRPDDIAPGTTGTPVPGYDIELRGDDGGLVPDGRPGSLYVRGESIALGYWRRTEASRTVFQGEWVNSGDTYVRTPEGYYQCLGRANDLIKAGGQWVSPAEVEARLQAHPAVQEVAVVAWRDPDGLDKPVAAVVRSGHVTADDLDQWCREALAAFKRPRRVLFVDELPKTATGKLQRFRVRQFVQERNDDVPSDEPTPVTR